MKNKSIVTGVSFLLFAFYAAIIMYILFGILEIDSVKNLWTAMVFEIISFVILIVLIVAGSFGKKFKTGYYIALVYVTVGYILLVDLFSFVFVMFLSNPIFILLNLLLLFIYCVIALPMFAVSRR